MPRHRKPVSPEPSKFVATHAEEIAKKANGLIVDIACGYGRNAVCIADFGTKVFCLDNNPEALEHIASLETKGQLQTQHVDLLKDPWPFEDNSLGAIINVHFLTSKLLDCFICSLKIGGLLLIETIDGHGNNYRQLPPQGFIKAALGDMFDIKHITERKVGPIESDASTLKLFAIKINAAIAPMRPFL